MIKTYLKNGFILSIIVAIFSACSNEKRLVYFQKTNNHIDTVAVFRPYVLTVQPGDILSIYVNSLSPEASSFFNPYSASGTLGAVSTGTNSAATSAALTQTSAAGFLVDAAGNIDYPIIGKLNVKNFTTAQVRDTIKSILKLYLKEPTVLVRILNFKISILGEVARPDVYNVPNETITLPEALSLAGDLTQFARRDSIEIVRDVNGKKVFGYVNLNTREVFNSPYYYLHANDLIYIKPSKVKVQQNDRSLQFATIGLSVLSILIIFLKK